MTYNDKISVIVANFNHAQFIEQALESLLKQTYKNIEIIIVDDGSTDSSKKVINKWYDQNHTKADIKSIYLPQNRGKWFALNTAIEQAEGTLIALQDSDDYSCSQRFERQLTCLKETGSYHNLCGFIHCWKQEDMDKHKNDMFEGSPKNIINHKETVRMVYKGFNTPGVNHFYLENFESHGASTLFYKQFWIHGMKFLPGNLGVRTQIAEDSDHNTKMTLLLQKTSILKEPLYLYRRGSATNPAYKEGK